MMGNTQVQALLAPLAAVVPASMIDAVALRERATDHYWERQDPLRSLRIKWRAQTARHMFHLLPGESILELGCGSGHLTKALARVSRSECPITAATFCYSTDDPAFKAMPAGVE